MKNLTKTESNDLSTEEYVANMNEEKKLDAYNILSKIKTFDKQLDDKIEDIKSTETTLEDLNSELDDLNNKKCELELQLDHMGLPAHIIEELRLHMIN